MTAALKDAVDNKEWIVVTGWKPHWMFGRWDLKFLKQDEDKMMWKRGNIHIMGNKNLRETKPELAQFLSNMYFTDAQLADLMIKVKESDQPIEEVVKTWMNNNEDVINKWIPTK
jgi:glycine betaine/proline transport system substrate-binding protein